MRWLHLRLEAPLASFGGDAIDARGVNRDFPARSMLTGLFANALGWTREMKIEHQVLQDRIVFGAAHDGAPELGRLTDFQTVKLGKGDRAWTTSGRPSGRAGGPATYQAMHRRWRDFHSDLRMSVVVRLAPAERTPVLSDLGAGLLQPVRPLFIGRKPCLPTRRMFAGWVKGSTAREALGVVIPVGSTRYALWPYEEGSEGADVTKSITDERNWVSGLHGGTRRVCLGRVAGRGDA